jgi:hypothetical protein
MGRMLVLFRGSDGNIQTLAVSDTDQKEIGLSVIRVQWK